MIPKDRLEDLEFRAANNGYSISDVERAKRQGLKLDDLSGAMISISPGELNHMFDEIQMALARAEEANDLADT